ncbi:MAG: DUF2125 domain-containing protein [Pseudorhodoplanes sp.]
MNQYRPAQTGHEATDQAPRRRSIGWLIPSLLLVILAAGWCAFWFYAVGQARERIAGWIEREQRSGRVYTCGDQSLGGFPFRIEFRCTMASAELPKVQPPLQLAMAKITAAVQVYQPTLLIAEIDGPVSIADLGQPAKMTANWSLAQISLRGTPRNPQRVSFASDKMTIDRAGADRPDRVFAASHAELHGRIASGSAQDNPVIDVATSLVSASAPALHPSAAPPFDLDADTRLFGLKNFAPKSWVERFREIQAGDGRIEVRNLRLKQGELLAVASGTLKLTPSGYLDGDLQVTATGVEKALAALGVDLSRMGGSRNERIGAALSFLDKLAPGTVTGVMSLLGEAAELEGRKAAKMPLRFRDGAVTLGPIKLGQTPALF